MSNYVPVKKVEPNIEAWKFEDGTLASERKKKVTIGARRLKIECKWLYPQQGSYNNSVFWEN